MRLGWPRSLTPGFGCRAPQGNKEQRSPVAALPENPAERISFRFGSKAFALVFRGWEEQKPRVASWLLTGSPLPPRRLRGDAGGRKPDRAVPVSHHGATARRGWS